MESKRKRDPDGRFDGVRWNVEDVPRLPTFPARWVLEDRRQRPYLVFWAPRHGPAFALKMAPSEGGDAVVITLENGETHRISVLRRRLPSGTGRALFYLCPSCRCPRRHLYLLKLSGDHLVDDGCLRCQECAGLRFASQGHYKPAFARSWGPYARNTWDPQAVSDPRLIAEDLAPSQN